MSDHSTEPSGPLAPGPERSPHSAGLQPPPPALSAPGEPSPSPPQGAHCPRCGFPLESSATAPCSACADPATPELLAPLGPPLAALVTGLRAPLQGLGFVSRADRHLWRWMILPPLMATLAFLLVLFSGWHLLGGFSDTLAAQNWGWLNWLRPATGASLGTAFTILLAALAYVAFAPISMALAGPFMDPIFRSVDRRVLGQSPQPSRGMLRDVLVAARDAIAMLALGLPITLLALLLNLIPVVGTPIYLVIVGYLTGLQALDGPLGRRHIPLRRRFEIARQNRAAVFGLGLTSYGLFLVPVVGWLLGPQSSGAGAAFLAHRLRKD